MECDKMKEFNHRGLIFFVVVYFFISKKTLPLHCKKTLL